MNRERWFKKGIDGFRMDVKDMIGKPPEMLQSDGGPHRSGSCGQRFVIRAKMHVF